MHKPSALAHCITSELKKEFTEAFPFSNFENVVNNLLDNAAKKIGKSSAEFERGEYNCSNSSSELSVVQLGNEITPDILESVPDNAIISFENGFFVYKLSHYTKKLPDANRLVAGTLRAYIESKNNLTIKTELPEYIKCDALNFEIPEKIISRGRRTVYHRDHILVTLRNKFESHYSEMSYFGLLNAIYNAENELFLNRTAEFERGEYNDSNSSKNTIEHDVILHRAELVKKVFSRYSHKNPIIKMCKIEEPDCETVPRIVYTEYKKEIECPVYMTAIRVINLCHKENTRIASLCRLANAVKKLSIYTQKNTKNTVVSHC